MRLFRFTLVIAIKGDITANQGVDFNDIAMEKIRILSVNLCAQPDGDESGEIVTLNECSGNDDQRFELREDGQFAPISHPELCLTAGPTSWLGGSVDAFNGNRDRTCIYNGVVTRP